jgi:hypothetical protein
MLNRMKEFAFRWCLDDEEDITLSVCGILHFTLYKWPDPTVRWGRNPEWQTITKGMYYAINKSVRSVLNGEG